MLRRYGILPTDDRFLRLRPWECEQLFWEDTLAARMAERVKKGLPVETLDQLTSEESFDERLATWDRELEARNETKASLPIEVEPVIMFRAGE